MKMKEFVDTLTRLQVNLEMNRIRVLADPLPYLEDMQRRCTELLQVLEEVEFALSPDCVFEVWDK